MNHEEMTKWVLAKIIDGMIAGTSLRGIAASIVFGLSTIVQNNLADAARAKGKERS